LLDSVGEYTIRLDSKDSKDSKQSSKDLESIRDIYLSVHYVVLDAFATRRKGVKNDIMYGQINVSPPSQWSSTSLVPRYADVC